MRSIKKIKTVYFSVTGVKNTNCQKIFTFPNKCIGDLKIKRCLSALMDTEIFSVKPDVSLVVYSAKFNKQSVIFAFKNRGCKFTPIIRKAVIFREKLLYNRWHVCLNRFGTHILFPFFGYTYIIFIFGNIPITIKLKNSVIHTVTS